MNNLATEAMQSWFIVKLAVALGPILTFGIADIIGWLLRRTIWRHPEVEPRPGGELAREEPAGVAAPPG